jgi:GAF domain-containing protein
MGKSLTRTLDFDATLDEVARLPVPQLGDWCLVYAPGDGDVRPQRLVTAHVDANADILLREMYQRPGLVLPRDHPVQVSLRTRKPVVRESCTALDLELMCANQREVDVFEAVRPRSLLALPMVAHGLMVGAIMLVSSSRRPRGFNRAFMESATAIARCAAQAIYNAQLFLEARLAVRLRDELGSAGTRDLLCLATGLQQRVNSLRCQLSTPAAATNHVFDTGLTDIEGLATAIRERLDPAYRR